MQGGGAGAHDGWDNKLVASLERELGAAYRVRYPAMPNEADPTYAKWKAALEQEFATLEDGACLLGHSIGATILIATLAGLEAKRTFGGVFLIAAPFIGWGGWPSDAIAPMDNLGLYLPEGLPVFLYHGTEDPIVPVAHLDLYAKAIPQAQGKRLAGRDHALNNDLKDIAADVLTRAGTRGPTNSR